MTISSDFTGGSGTIAQWRIVLIGAVGATGPTGPTGASSGVTLVTGGTGPVTVSPTTGVVTVSIPQSVATTATPTFASTTLSTGSPNLVLNCTSTASPNRRGILWETAGSDRWLLDVAAFNEAGSNSGSNFVLTRFDDAGVSLGTAVNIVRSTGAVTFGGAVDIVGNTSRNGVQSYQLVAIGSAACTTNYTTTTTAADVTGASVVLSLQAGDIIEITSSWDMRCAATNILCEGFMLVGISPSFTALTGNAIMNSSGTVMRATTSQSWNYSVPTTGSYTLKMQARHTGATAYTIGATHTRFRYTVFR